MAKKKTGISRDLIIHPGETIADILAERNISQKELATQTGVTCAYISSIISGKKGISPNFAMALEYALGVPKSFWLNLQSNYEAEILELNELSTITSEEYSVLGQLKEVAKYLKIDTKPSADNAILELRKALQISNISNLERVLPCGAFRTSTKASVSPIILGAWLRVCQIEGEKQRIYTSFNPENIDSLVSALKEVIKDSPSNYQERLRELFSRYGIKFSIIANFRGAPVQGYISKDSDGIYQMALTTRGSTADIFWFTLFHELGHIVNGDLSRTGRYIDASHAENDAKERKADLFAQNTLLDPLAYSDFIKEKDFSIQSISTFAKSQCVTPCIVIGRLQKEGHIPYSWYSSYKTPYKLY